MSMLFIKNDMFKWKMIISMLFKILLDNISFKYFEKFNKIMRIKNIQV